MPTSSKRTYVTQDALPAFAGEGLPAALRGVKVGLAASSPEGVVTAPPGSYVQVRGGTPSGDDGLWVKSTGTGSTGWSQVNGGTAGVTAVTGSAPIVSSGGLTPDISISAATSGADGSMSAADKAKLDTFHHPLIWKWNETDASQFTVCKDEIATGSVQVTKVSGAEGPRLRVKFPTKATGLLMTSIMINDLTLPLYDTDAKRYIFSFRLVGISDFTHYTEWYSAGASFLGNKLTGSSHYSLSAMTQVGTATRYAYIAGGTTSLSGGTPSWPQFDLNLGLGDDRSLSALFAYNTTARKTAGSPPKFRGNFQLDVPAASSSARNTDMMNEKTFAASVGAFGSGWNSATLDTCGLAFLGNTGTTSNYYFEFDSLCVFRHPMDL